MTGSLVCHRPWGCNMSDTIEQLNNNNRINWFMSARIGDSCHFLCLRNWVKNHSMISALVDTVFGLSTNELAN